MSDDDLFRVRDLVVMVTGAASGLGMAISEVLAERGAQLVLMDNDGARLEARRRDMTKVGHRVDAHCVDIGDARRLRVVFEAVMKAHRRLDVVFANAGITGGPGPASPEGRLAEIEEDKWRRVLDINLTGAMFTLREAAATMKQRGGRIILTSSMSGTRGDRNTSYAYGAAKAALNNIVKQAAIELAPDRILVNAMCPGAFATNIADGRLHAPEVVEKYEKIIPLGRIGHTDEIKGLALFLASPASSYVTGALISIDGGVTAALC